MGTLRENALPASKACCIPISSIANAVAVSWLTALAPFSAGSSLTNCRDVRIFHPNRFNAFSEFFWPFLS